MDQENEYLCKKCGVNLIDKTESEHSILCTTCRKEQIAYPIPKVLLGAIGLILGIVIVLCIVTLPSSMKDYRAYLDDYDSLLASNYNTLNGDEKLELNNVQAIDVIDTAMSRGQYSYAIEIFNEYLAGKTASDSEIKKLESYMGKLEAYSNVTSKYEEIYNNLDKSLTTDEMSDVLVTELNKLIGDKSYDQATVYYMLGQLGKDDEEIKKYLNLSLSEDPNYLDSKVQLANVLRRNKEFSEAKSLYNEIIAKHENNSGALRGMAILDMLEGNFEEAAKLAKAAYDSNVEEYYVYETLIIALNKNGQLEESQKYIDEYKAKGYELEEDTLNLLAGSITLEEYYLN